jgi:hypothetical protein
MAEKINRDSPLVQSVATLDNLLSELERVGKKINGTDMSGDVDLEHVQKLMARFAECGQGLAQEIGTLSAKLREAQDTAQSIAQGVSQQAERFKARKKEQDDKVEEFRLLGERARALNDKIIALPKSEIAANLPAVETDMAALIEELLKFRQTARQSSLRSLERNAESLSQALQAVQKKLQVIPRE